VPLHHATLNTLVFEAFDHTTARCIGRRRKPAFGIVLRVRRHAPLRSPFDNLYTGEDRYPALPQRLKVLPKMNRFVPTLAVALGASLLSGCAATPPRPTPPSAEIVHEMLSGARAGFARIGGTREGVTLPTATEQVLYPPAVNDLRYWDRPDRLRTARTIPIDPFSPVQSAWLKFCRPDQTLTAQDWKRLASTRIPADLVGCCPSGC
jgi:hypothetical protein